MRRLLAVIATSALLLGLASPAIAGNRMPSGVKRISITLTFPLKINGKQNVVRRTLTGSAAVKQVVGAVDALRVIKHRGICPMYMRLGPTLTVIFLGSHGQKLAATRVQVAVGSHGTSGTTPCFPIQFTAGSQSQMLVGNRYVRLVGHLLGTSIS